MTAELLCRQSRVRKSQVQLATRPKYQYDNRDPINHGHVFFFVFHFELAPFSDGQLSNVLARPIVFNWESVVCSNILYTSILYIYTYILHIYQHVFFWPFGIFSFSGRGSFHVWHAGSPPRPRTQVWALAEVRGACSGGSKSHVRSGGDSEHVEPS